MAEQLVLLAERKLGFSNTRGEKMKKNAGGKNENCLQALVINI